MSHAHDADRHPHEPCNTLIGGNKLGPVSDPSRIPALAEPFFLNFNADCRIRICMTPADLGNAGLDEIARRWS